MAIVTVDQVKHHLNIPLADTSQDAELTDAIAAVTEVIEHIVGPVDSRQVIETHDGGSNAIALRRPPVLSVTSVVENGTAVTTDVYSAALPEGVLYRESTSRWVNRRGAVTVTYQAGRATVPASIAMAAKELVALNFRPQMGGNYSPFDSAGDAPPDDRQMILGFFVPNRVRQLLLPYEQLAGTG